MTTFTVNTTTNETYDGGDLAAETADGTGLSLIEAIGLASSGDTITFDASLSGQSLTAAQQYHLDFDVTIDGDINNDGTPDITLNASNYASNFVRVDSGATVTLDGLTISGTNGGIPIYVNGSTLTILNSVITANSGTWSGVYATNSDVTLRGSRVEYNTGGGTSFDTNGGTINIIDSSVIGNTASNTVQIVNPTSATISGSVIAHNTFNGVIVTGPIDISNSIFTGNANTELILSANAVATVSNSIFAGTGTPISFISSPQTLTFSGTNVVSAALGVAYSGDAPTVETTLTNIFAGVTGNGGTLSTTATDSGATIYTALVNPTGAAQGLGPQIAATIGGNTTGSITENAASTTGALTISDDNGAAEESFSAGTINGSYGSLDIAANGDWTYSLDNANVTVQALRDGHSLVDNVTVSSADGTTQNIAVTINGVTDTNGPTRPDLSGTSVMENVPGAVIGTLSSTSTGGSDISYTVSDDRFEVVDDVLKLKDGVSLDYETEESVSLYVQANNGAGSYHRPFTISVEDVDEKTGTVDSDTLTGSAQVDYIAGGRGHDKIDGQDGDDTLGGGSGDDQVDGGAGADMIWGGAGDDTLDGGDGDDILYNGSGADRVSGSAGNDTLWAGAGDDTLSGGEGADTFIIGAASGNDVVTDFDTSEDTLHLAYSGAGFTDLADVEAAASETSVDGASGLLIDLGNGQSVFLIGLTTGDLPTMDITL